MRRKKHLPRIKLRNAEVVIAFGFYFMKTNLLRVQAIKIKQRERERERRIAELRTRIDELETIANRTLQQEQELQDKKRELAQLENQQQSGGDGDPKNLETNYWL